MELLFVIFLYFSLLSLGVTQRCIGEAVNVTLVEAMSEYEVTSTDCIMSLHVERKGCIMASFDNFNNDKWRYYFDIKVFDNDDEQRQEMNIDGVPNKLDPTAIASRGTNLTINFPKGFNYILNLYIKKIICRITDFDIIGNFSIPTFNGKYPKNLNILYQIYPLLGSTTILQFLNIDIRSGHVGNDIDMVSVNGIAETDIGYGTLDNVTLYRTDTNVTINISSNQKNDKRGSGFCMKFQVCTLDVDDSNGTFELPLPTFRKIDQVFRCSFRIKADESSIPVLTIVNKTDQRENETNFIEILNGAQEQPMSLTRFDSLPETYVSSIEEIMLVYNLNDDFSVIQGNYSWISKDCSHSYTVQNGALPWTDYMYLGKYANNFECNYTISSGPSDHIILFFKDIALASVDCRDNIEVKGENSSDQLLICNSKNNQSVTFATASNMVYIRFKTDGNLTDMGFAATWSVCGGKNSYPRGNVTFSPHAPNNTSPAKCSYILGSGRTETILLHLQLSEAGTCFTIDESSTDLCSNTTIALLNGKANVRFPSDNTDFTLYWTESSISEKSSEFDQWLQSFGFGDNFYPTNSKIVYTIRKDGDSAISVTFIKFVGGCDDGNVTIEFTNTTSNETERQLLCGTLEQRTFLSSENVQLILRTGAGSFKGFEVLYKNVLSATVTGPAGDGDSKGSASKSFWTSQEAIYVYIAIPVAIVLVTIVICFIRLRKRLKIASSKDESPVIDGKENPTFDKNAGDVKPEPVYADQPDGVYDKLRESRDKKGKKVHDDVTYSAGDIRSDPTYDKAGETREELVPYDVTYSDGKRASMNIIAQEGKTHSNKTESNGDAVNKPPEMVIEDNEDGIERNDKQYTMVHKRFDSTKKSTSEGANGAGEMSKM